MILYKVLLMELHEREFFIYRILAGYTKLIINNIELKIYPPSYSILYDANILYNEVYEECKKNNLYTEFEMHEFLKNINMWSEDEEKRIKILTDALDDIKLRMYQNVFNSNNIDRYRSNLRDAEKELISLLSKKKIYDAYTCEGVATYSKLQYIIENTTKKNGVKYNWEDMPVSSVFSKLQNETISDKIMRYLSHNEPWNSIWHINKKGGRLFKNKYLSEEQRRITSWSMMYDNIYKSPECPHESVIEDDDILDGWLVLQRKEREQKQQQKRSESVLSKKIAESQEVYIVANTPEDIKKVYDMNSPQAKSIVESRKRKLKKENRDIDIREFDDIKIKVLNEINKGK